MQLKHMQNKEELVAQRNREHKRQQNEWGKEADVDYAEMCKRDLD